MRCKHSKSQKFTTLEMYGVWTNHPLPYISLDIWMLLSHFHFAQSTLHFGVL